MRPMVAVTMVMGTLGLVLVGAQVAGLSSEIVAQSGISGTSAKVFDLPAHILLVLVALPACLALVGIWRSRR